MNTKLLIKSPTSSVFAECKNTHVSPPNRYLMGNTEIAPFFGGFRRNSAIEEARISAQEKYQSLGNNKELSHAEKIKISEDYGNEQLEKKLDLLLENIK
ncbi:MAG: hypothetical protein J6Y30_00360 [Treponema sp.]|nr:hypothetical protein [Treponema sp.]